MNMRKLLFRLGTLVVILVIAACMMVIDRGHTVYFDNRTLELEDQTCDAYRRINVFVNGEQVAKLSAKDRGMATFMGQRFSFDVEATKEKGDDPITRTFNIKVPYSWDGTVVNLPAMLAELPESDYASKFVPMARLSLETLADAVIDDEGRAILNASFEYTGSSAVTSQWQSLDESVEGAEWTDIPGANSLTYEIPSENFNAEIAYRCIVTDGTLNDTSNAAHVSEGGATSTSEEEESF